MRFDTVMEWNAFAVVVCAVPGGNVIPSAGRIKA